MTPHIWRRTAALAVVLASFAARADIFSLDGYGPRATAMGGAMTAEANDYTSVFYNPGLLVNRKDINFGFHVAWHRLMSDVHAKDLARDLDCTSCNPQDAAGTAFGLIFPLAGKVKNRVAIGVGVYLPVERLVRVFAPDPNRPVWYHYTGSPERLILHAGVGIKVVEGFNIGLGVQMLADLTGNGATVAVDLFSKQVKSREIDSGLQTRVAPVVGISVAPTDHLRFGATFRSQMELDYIIPASVDLTGVGTLGFTVSGVTHFMPHNLSVGMAWDPTDDVTISAEAQWMNWSAAPSPYTDLKIDLSGPTLTALGLDSALDVSSLAQKPGFADTVNGRLGIEYRLSERFAARAGLSWRPTPVPKQNVSGTNLMDADTLGASIGCGFNFPDPLEIFQHPVTIDLAAQGAYLFPREAVKDPTDEVPSYQYSARVIGVTAAIRYDF